VHLHVLVCDGLAQRLARILQDGALRDATLDSQIRRLDARYASWLASYPLGEWGPGLAVTREMRVVSETYLPMDEIRRAFRRLFRLSFLQTPCYGASRLLCANSWLDLLPAYHPFMGGCNPALLLRRLADDAGLRLRFLFAEFLPPRYGCRSGRYPHQTEQVRGWLHANRQRFGGGIRCLDAACGSGEGTYDLVRLLLEEGYPVGGFCVHGTTLEPLELFAGAHAVFPHDTQREEAFRARVAPIFGAGGATGMSFFLGDVLESAGDGGRYDLIVCNGLIGGPMLHAESEAMRGLSVLADALAPAGMLCIADSFHEGWSNSSSRATLAGLAAGCGLSVSLLPDGICALRE